MCYVKFISFYVFFIKKYHVIIEFLPLIGSELRSGYESKNPAAYAFLKFTLVTFSLYKPSESSI